MEVGMRSWLITIAIGSIAAVLLCRALRSQRSPIEQWRHRLGAIRSPIMNPAAYKVLLIFVVVGVLLIAVLPESVFVLPALDAIGLDIATILVALELRHYLTTVRRLIRIRSVLALCRHGPEQLVHRFRETLRSNPALQGYAVLWLLIITRWMLETASSLRRARA